MVETSFHTKALMNCIILNRNKTLHKHDETNRFHNHNEGKRQSMIIVNTTASQRWQISKTRNGK